MPTFPSPRPLNIHLDVLGEVRIVTSDRTDTVVEVRPVSESRESDRRAAERTAVQCSGDTLTVKVPRTRSPFSRGGVVEILIETPAGATVDGKNAMGSLVVDGPLADCRFTTALGDIRLTTAASVSLATATGEIVAGQLGDAKIRAAGLTRIGRIGGSAEIKNINGETRIEEVTGDIRVRSSNGAVEIGRTAGSADVSTALGHIRLGEVGPGTVSAQTSTGDVQVGVAAGVAAWLDVNTSYGSATSTLESSRQPERGEPTVRLRARTSYGNIRIHRSERTPA